MNVNRAAAVGWYHAVVAGALPWIAHYRLDWLPAATLLLVVAQRRAFASQFGEPWRSAVVVCSAVVALGVTGGWPTAAGWLLLGGISAGVVLAVPRLRYGRRPDALDFAMTAVWAAAFVLRPQLLEADGGGWLAPLLLLFGLRRLVCSAVRLEQDEIPDIGPPSREVRGTLSLSGVVADKNGLVKTSPLELEMRAGSSVAILYDESGEASDLAWTLCGRRPPASGQVSVDGVPMQPEEHLVAVISVGEAYLEGGLDENLLALKDEEMPAGARAAVVEACSLAEVEAALKGRAIEEDGQPLGLLHRFLVQAARIVVSHYRIVVVLDPMPWVNPVRAELWRGAVVRASVGRTAVWLTSDRALAGRADRILELRHGTLKEA